MILHIYSEYMQLITNKMYSMRQRIYRENVILHKNIHIEDI